MRRRHFISTKSLKLANIILVILVAAGLSSWYIIADGHRYKNQLMISNADIAAGLIEPAIINKLNQLNPEALAKDNDYLFLKKHLTDIGEKIKNTRFVYLLAQKTDGIYILIDTQPSRFNEITADSVASPGEFYAETDSDYSSVVTTNKALTFTGTEDKWGKFNTVMSPIRDPQTGAVIAIVGIDITTADWLIDDFNHLLPLIIITIILLIAGFIYYRISKETLIFKERLVITQHTVDKSSQPIIWVDEQGLIVYTNESAKQYIIDNKPSVDLKLWEAYGILNQKSWTQYWQQLKHEQQLKLVTALQRGNNTKTKFELRINYITHNNQDYAIIFGYDISQQAIAAKQKQSNEELYHLLFNKMPSAFIYGQTLNDNKGFKDFVFLEVNKTYAQETNISSDQLIGKKYSEVSHLIPKTNINWPDLFNEVVQSGTNKELEIFVEASNKYFQVNVYSPSTGFFIAIFKDVSAKHASDEELLASQKKLKNLFDNLPDILLVFTQDYKIIKANQSAALQLNINLEKIIGYDLRKLLAPSSIEKLSELEKNINLNTTNVYNLDFIDRHGKLVPCELIAKNINYQGQKLIMANLRNMTEQRKKEAELQQSNSQLRKMQIYGSDRELRLLELQKTIANKKKLLLG